MKKLIFVFALFASPAFGQRVVTTHPVAQRVEVYTTDNITYNPKTAFVHVYNLGLTFKVKTEGFKYLTYKKGIIAFYCTNNFGDSFIKVVDIRTGKPRMNGKGLFFMRKK